MTTPRLCQFVTAKLAGSDECRQGAVISLDPLAIRCKSGEEFVCEGEPVPVVNPPPDCIGCDLPLGPLCDRCKRGFEALEQVLSENNLGLA